MDEKDLEILIDLSKTGNISRTAERLFTTQSAVTKRLQKLEDDLGAPLFVRSKKGLLAEPLLSQILPDVIGAAQAMDRVRSTVGSSGGEICGTLRLGITVNYARYRLPEVLDDFMRRFPKVDIHIRAGRSVNVYQDLMNGEVSFAIVRGEYVWRGSDMVISTDRHCLVRSRQHADTSLSSLTFIGRDSDTAYQAGLSAWFAEQGLHPSRSELIINDVETIINLVERGIGWSVLPEISLKRFTGLAEPVFFADGSPFVHRTHILCREDYLSLPQAAAFAEVVMAHEAVFDGGSALTAEK